MPSGIARDKVLLGSGGELQRACPGSPILESLRAHAEPAASTRSFAPPEPTGCTGTAWNAKRPANLPLAGPTRFARLPTTTFAQIAYVDDASSTTEKLGVRAKPELIAWACAERLACAKRGPPAFPVGSPWSGVHELVERVARVTKDLDLAGFKHEQ